MTKPRLVAFDLDGTLAESKQPVTKEMGVLLSKLLEFMPVAVMSGAGFPQFEKQFLSSLPEHANIHNLYLLPENAAEFFSFKNGRWQALYDHRLLDEEKETIERAINEVLKETGIADEIEKTWGEKIEDRGGQITFSGLGQEAPISEKSKWDPRGEKRRRIVEELLKRIPQFSIGTGGMTSIDITRKGITKAYGLKRLGEFSGIAISEMLYVGDALQEGGNDAVVKETGVKTLAVSGPQETTERIEEILREALET